MDDFNDRVVAEFRANEGRVGGELAGMRLLLLHHTGARSGVERVTPLAYTRRRDRRWLVTASNGGSATHPAWYENLKANPAARIEIGAETFPVLAQVLEGAERAAVWPDLVAASPALREFQAKAGREIPVVVLSGA